MDQNGSSSNGRLHGKSKRKRNSMKVVYISNPIRVKTSASRFRSLVQQLTGRNSDIISGHSTHPEETVFDDHKRYSNPVNEVLFSSSPAEETTQGNEWSDDQQSSSSVLLEDCVFRSDMVEQLEEMFPSSLSQVSTPIPSVYSQLDHVLASFS